jgi:two-component system OmpR family sensor kinase
MTALRLGRLFWKFLIFFFLAQVTAVLGIGLAIWAIKPDHGLGPPPPPPSFEAQGSTGEFRGFGPPPHLGDEESLRRLPPPPGPKLPLFHLLAGALVSLIFAALLAAYVSRPILRLRQALQAGAKGELSPGLSAEMGDRRDELADLGRDFDRMAQHLGLLMAGQRRLLHDVSHELRSPLARLNAIIGVARQQPDYFVDCLSLLEHESMRMDRLLSELLTLSRLESGIGRHADEQVDLAELLNDVVSDAAPEVEQAGCRVELSVEQNVQVRGDPEMLHRLFDNLLRNALTHAPSGGWVGISLTYPGAGNGVLARIEDCGPGVPAAELEQLFVPFYRGTNVSGQNGHGLGLAIAKQIVDCHQGRIEASNRPGGGLCLSISLPGTTVVES